MAALVLALAGCGGGQSGGTPADPGLEPSGGALVPAQAGDVVAFVRARLETRQDYRARDATLRPVFAPVGAAESVAVPAIGAGAAAPAADTAHSGTVLQEAGVDEDDLLKTDGRLLIALARAGAFASPQTTVAEVQIHARQADGRLEPLSRTPLPTQGTQTAVADGLYHAADLQRVAVLSHTQTYYVIDMCRGGGACPAVDLMPSPPMAARPQVWIDVLDVADPAAPVRAPRIRIDGTLLGSRRMGPYLYLVTQHQPVLPVELLPLDAPAGTRSDLMARLQAADLLPTRQVGTAPAELLTRETDCYLQTDNASPDLALTTLTVLDLADGGRPVGGRCFVGGSEALYLAPQSLYLATTRYGYDVTAALPRFADGMRTDLHKFALDGATLDYRGSGSVAGHLGWDMEKKALRLSEHDGHLRVVTHTQSWGWVQPQDQPAPAGVPPSPARLTILREADGERRLATVGTLPNERRPQPLGKDGEQVYGVRLLGTRGYVVTFRRIDPLYVLDLSDPSDPRALGEVEAAGFSDYLFPLGENLLLGVGKDADARGVAGGVKVAVFDVADGTRPREVARRTFGLAGSLSGLDVSRHGIDLHTVGGAVRVGLPMVTVDDPAFASHTRGLQRLDVDLSSGALAVRPLLAPAGSARAAFGIGDDRSVQIGEHVYYWADEAFAAQAW